jgi:hypothetical protein
MCRLIRVELTPEHYHVPRDERRLFGDSVLLARREGGASARSGAMTSW